MTDGTVTSSSVTGDADRIPGMIAELLLQAQAVTLNVREPYRYASGLLSPIYCDNRLLLSFPERRRLVVDAFCDRIRSLAPLPELIAGVATAGIAWAAWIADRLDLPLVYVRANAKEHGKGNRIEGTAPAGARVAVIEDLLSTGGSSVAALEALRTAGLNPIACMAIFSYQLPACRAAFDSIGVRAVPLSTFDALMTAADRLRMLSPADLAIARDWNRDPHAWGERMQRSAVAPLGEGGAQS